MQTAIRFVIFAAGATLCALPARASDQPSPFTNANLGLPSYSELKAQSAKADVSSNNETARAILSPSTKLPTSLDDLSNDDLERSSFTQAVNLPKFTIFAYKNPGLGNEALYTDEGLADAARKLNPTLAFRGQRVEVSLALYKVHEEQRLQLMDYFARMVALTDATQDEGGKKQLKSDMDETFLRRRDSTYEFLHRFYAQR